jgi:hypothetical protein
VSKLALAAATLCAGLLAGCASATATPDASGTTPPPSSSPSASASASPTEAAPVLGPDGFGPIKLGMKLDEVEATGLVTPATGTAPDAGCDARVKITAGAGGTDGVDGLLYFSPNIGLASITMYGDVKTPEGIGLGSTVVEVEQAYPTFKVEEESAAGWVPASATATYRIGVTKDGKVASILLQSNKQDCYE